MSTVYMEVGSMSFLDITSWLQETFARDSCEADHDNKTTTTTTIIANPATTIATTTNTAFTINTSISSTTTTTTADATTTADTTTTTTTTTTTADTTTADTTTTTTIATNESANHQCIIEENIQYIGSGYTKDEEDMNSCQLWCKEENLKYFVWRADIKSCQCLRNKYPRSNPAYTSGEAICGDEADE